MSTTQQKAPQYEVKQKIKEIQAKINSWFHSKENHDQETEIKKLKEISKFLNENNKIIQVNQLGLPKEVQEKLEHSLKNLKHPHA